jgi:hypothetical protein
MLQHICPPESSFLPPVTEAERTAPFPVKVKTDAIGLPNMQETKKDIISIFTKATTSAKAHI